MPAAMPGTLSSPNAGASNLSPLCHGHQRSILRETGIRRRKPDLDAQTWVVIHHFDARIVQLCDRSDEAKAEAIAGVAPAALKAIKALEDALVLVHRNSGTAISDGNRRASGILGDLDANLARPAVPDCVVEEI